MKTVIYSDPMANTGSHLIRTIQEQIPGMVVNACDSITDLSNMLCRPLNQVSVIVFLVSSRKELIEFNFMVPLFDNARIVLILPDRGEITRSLCFKLKPSFVSYADNDLNDVVAVLAQIHEKSKAERQRPGIKENKQINNQSKPL